MNAILRRSILLASLACVVSGPAWAGSPSCSTPAAIRFASGASAGTAEGGIARGEVACWTVEAKAGQVLTLGVESPERNVVVQFYRPGWRVTDRDGGTTVVGKALPGADEGEDATRWSGALPASGDYLVVVGTSRGGGSYTMRVEVGKPR